jgi:hypothetical protein
MSISSHVDFRDNLAAMVELPRLFHSYMIGSGETVDFLLLHALRWA